MLASTLGPKGGAQCVSSARWDLRGGRPEPNQAKGCPYRDRWPLLCHGIYITSVERSRSPLEVPPILRRSLGRFAVAPAAGFDVNPVTWHLLSGRGIAVRGPSPRALQIQTDDRELRAWSLAYLNTYWRRWAAPTRQSRFVVAKLPSRRYAAWGIFGVPRLHYTLATGEIASKEEAGHYALRTFEPRWRPLIEDALAFWHGDRPVLPYPGLSAAPPA
jgi:hypothetical protein